MVVFDFWPGVCKSYFRVARQPQTKRNLKRRGNPMSYLKYAIATLALTLFVAPSIASAQSLQTLGTRRGAIGGAILGAIIGDQNNEGIGRSRHRWACRRSDRKRYWPKPRPPVFWWPVELQLRRLRWCELQPTCSVQKSCTRSIQKGCAGLPP